jgi:putative N6-adenine-specific DNA methylase
MKAPHLRKGRERPRHLYFIPVPRGLEPALLAEMEALGLPEPRGVEAGAFFRGTLEDCYRANLWLRTGARVLRVVAEFPCADERALYREARQVDWFRLLDPDLTIAVRARLGRSRFTHSQYLSRLVKDAIVDEFREAFGRRPSVDKAAPAAQIHAWFDQDRCTLSLDSSGEPLFKRGYRRETGEAPLRENLAAGLIGLAGWHGERPFRDIMAGSGTLAIEAALIATQRAPGLTRAFGFERWPDYQRSLWKRLRAEAEARVRSAPVEIRASDHDPRAIERARRNAEAAGVAEAIHFERADFRETSGQDGGSGPGVLLVNPPYGERIGAGPPLPRLYKDLGDVLKQRYKGWEAYVFTVHGELIKSIGLRPSRRTILFNGALECRLLQFKLY